MNSNDIKLNLDFLNWIYSKGLFSPQLPRVSLNVALSVGTQQGDDVTVLNGCQEERKTGSAKVKRSLCWLHSCSTWARVD